MRGPQICHPHLLLFRRLIANIPSNRWQRVTGNLDDAGGTCAFRSTTIRRDVAMELLLSSAALLNGTLDKLRAGANRRNLDGLEGVLGAGARPQHRPCVRDRIRGGADPPCRAGGGSHPMVAAEKPGLYGGGALLGKACPPAPSGATSGGSGTRESRRLSRYADASASKKGRSTCA